MTNFYRVHGDRLTYAEYWRMSPDPFSFLLAAGLKTVGLPLPFNFSIPRPDKLFLVALDELPGSARFALKRPVAAAERDGLRLVFCHRLAVVESHRLGAAALLLDEQNGTCLNVMFGQHGEKRELQLSVVSEFDEDTRAVTTTMKKTMTPVPGSRIARLPKAGVGELLGRHAQLLDECAGDGYKPLRLDPNRLPQTVLRWELKYVDFHINRGVFVPMTDDEVDRLAGD